MSFFWSSWITIFSLGCWLFIMGVLVATLKYRPPLEEDGTTGHEYDGIKEYDKPLPKWWLWVFFGTLLWGLAYFALYPSVQPAEFKGLSTVQVEGQELPWTSENELNSDLEGNNNLFVQNFTQVLDNAGASQATPILAKLSELQKELDKAKAGNEDEQIKAAELQKQIDEQLIALAPFVDKLATDPEALKMGNRLFLQNCALCHGSNAAGSKGYPNLTDNDWLYGGESAHVLTTIHNGRVGGMAAWQNQIGETGVRAAAEYVLSISQTPNVDNGELDKTLVAQGKAIFDQNCTLCHGKDAKGLIEMGAPNLTDDIWLYGADRESVRETIRHGRAGVMPAWATRMGEERVMLMAAYVRSLSQSE